MADSERPPPPSQERWSMQAGERVVLAVDFYSAKDNADYEPGAYLVCRRQYTRRLTWVSKKSYGTRGLSVREGATLGMYKMSKLDDIELLRRVIASWCGKYRPIAMSRTFSDVLTRLGIAPPANMPVLILSAS